MIQTSGRSQRESFDAERKVELLRALNAAAAMLQRSAHSEFEVYRAVKEQIGGLGLRGSLWVLDEAGDRLTLRAVAYPGQVLASLERLTGLKAEGFEFAVAKVDVFRQVVEGGQTVFASETVGLLAQILPRAVRPFAERIFSMIENAPGIFAPLIIEGRVRGVLSAAGAGLTEEDVPAVEAFANHVAVALDNAHLFATVQEELLERGRAEQIQNAAYRISEAVLTASDLEALFRSIHGIISELMPARNFYIALYDETTGLLSFPYFVDDYDEWSPPKKPEKGLTEYVMRTGKPLLASPDVFDDLVRRGEVALVGVDSIDWLGVPLKIGEQTIGVLAVQTYTEGVRYSDEDKAILTFVSAQTALAIGRKRAEDALRESEERYRLMFESNPHPMWVYDLETLAFLAVNDAAVHHYGYSREEFLRVTLKDIRPPEDVSALLENVSRVTEGMDEASVWRHRRKDGTIIDVEITSHTLNFAGRRAEVVLAHDITERKRAEDALRESVHKYRMLVEQATDVISITNPQGDYIEVNSKACELLGYTREELLQMNMADLIPPEDLAAQPIHFAELRAGQTVLTERRLRRKDGSPVLVETSARMLEDGRIQAIVRDITERKRVEAALRENVHKYRMLVEQAADVISIIDPEGNYIEVNSKACELLGYTRAELLRMNAVDFIPPEDLAAKPIHFAELRAGQTVLTERRLRRKDGSLVLVETSARMLEDGRTQAITRDITERKRVEAALRESEERLRLAVTAAQMDTWEWDILADRTSSGGYRQVAPPAGTYESFVARVYPADREVIEQAVQRTVENGEPYNVEFRTVRPDGSIRWLASQGQTLRGESGRAVRLIGVTQDITERKQAEEALRQAQKMESLGVLAGGIAHDFNNLLVAMLGQASLALAQLPPESSARTHVEKVVKAAERAADLTRQMLAYSGRGQFEKRAVNLNKLIHENLHLFEVAVPKNVQLRSLPAEPLPTIEGDVGQLQQVIMNLIINAAEAIGERPGTVRVTTGVQEVSAADDQLWRYTGEPLAPGEHVVLEVSDDGSGMSVETLSKIFDPFFTTKFTGRGLGLAAVLGIVRGHRGGLSVDSEVGRGTTFRLLFPAGGEASSEPIALRAAAPAGASPGLVLVIDDEAPVREAVADILEIEGVQVVGAATGAAGIDLYRDRAAEIGLVLLDLSMPGMTGDETLRRLREISPDIRVILSSGYSEAEATRRFTGLGLVGFIQKPYDAASLVAVVREHLA